MQLGQQVAKSGSLVADALIVDTLLGTAFINKN